jgi:uncharacterized protein YjbI with pentapeptide repeats
MRYSVLAGARYDQSSLAHSDIIHASFLGLNARSVSFDNSDLYHSVFTSSRLVDTSFADCNLKRGQFYLLRAGKTSLPVLEQRGSYFEAGELL